MEKLCVNDFWWRPPGLKMVKEREIVLCCAVIYSKYCYPLDPFGPLPNRCVWLKIARMCIKIEKKTREPTE